MVRARRKGWIANFTRHNSITIKSCQELFISHSNDGQRPRNQGLGSFRFFNWQGLPIAVASFQAQRKELKRAYA